MATPAGAAAETDCCGNLYPLNVPLGTRRADPAGAWRLAATTIVVAARAIWTMAVVCAWPGLL